MVLRVKSCMPLLYVEKQYALFSCKVCSHHAELITAVLRLYEPSCAFLFWKLIFLEEYTLSHNKTSPPDHLSSDWEGKSMHLEDILNLLSDCFRELFGRIFSISISGLFRSISALLSHLFRHIACYSS